MSAQLVIGNVARHVEKTGSSPSGFVTNVFGSIYINDKYTLETIPVNVINWDVSVFGLNITATFSRDQEIYNSWQLKSYAVIMRAYRDRLAEYNEKMSQNQVQGEAFLGSNPLFYRQIEQITLKKNCLSYLLEQNQMGGGFSSGTDFATYKVTQSQAMDDYASRAKFIEQAFEWDIMSYNFYPYYWGYRQSWVQLYQTENDDALFRSFMQSGMARVVVSVKPGFEDAVMHYMATREIWDGGDMPVIGDPLYLSIVDELAEQEYTIEETWETVLPTSLTGLQQGGVAVEGSGLPCGSGCEDGHNPLIPNDHKLGPEIVPVVE